MGKEIVYCHKCGIRITEREFSRGLAHTIANLPSCTRCRPLATPTLPVNDPDDRYSPLTPSGRTRSARDCPSGEASRRQSLLSE